jgi:hypothetical protein
VNRAHRRCLDIHFSIRPRLGGCEAKIAMCLPTSGWNYILRFYRSHAEIVNQGWNVPGRATDPVKHKANLLFIAIHSHAIVDEAESALLRKIRLQNVRYPQTYRHFISLGADG